MSAAPNHVLGLAECARLLAGARPTGAEGNQALPAEELAHRAAILEIAAVFHRPPEEVAWVYCEVLARLAGHASVADFLPVLAEKHVRSRYRLQAGTAPIPQPGGVL